MTLTWPLGRGQRGITANGGKRVLRKLEAIRKKVKITLTGDVSAGVDVYLSHR